MNVSGNSCFCQVYDFEQVVVFSDHKVRLVEHGSFKVIQFGFWHNYSVLYYNEQRGAVSGGILNQMNLKLQLQHSISFRFVCYMLCDFQWLSTVLSII